MEGTLEKLLNVHNEVEVNVLGDLEDHSKTDTHQVTRGVKQAVKEIQNGNAVGEDEIAADI